MRTVQRVALPGLIAHLAVLALLAGTVGLGPAAWIASVGYAVGTVVLLARAVARSEPQVLGPADVVTTVRSALVGGVAALVADAFTGPVPVALLTALAVVALLLDAVDGWVARSTGTGSAVGARFDMEVDSALVLPLSVYVAQTLGPWVLAIGSVHYVLLAARRLLPWLRRPASRVVQSHHTSRPNDSASSAATTSRAATATARGSTSAAATVRTAPCTAATTLHQKRGGAGRRSHGRSRRAASST